MSEHETTAFKDVDQNQKACDQGNVANAYYPNPHVLIQEHIHYHNTMANNLWALYRALPRELPREAADALATLINNSRARY